MKGTDPSLSGALLLSMLLRVLLQGQAQYWSRAGLLTLLPGVLLTALAGALFARAWPLAGGRALRLLFAALLAVSAAQTLLRLWRLYAAVYPDAVSLLGICLTVLLPVVYLRRVSAIAQTANVVLGLLLAAGAVLVVSLGGRLRVTNLQTALPAGALGQALAAQCALPPELLLPALCLGKRRPAGRTAWRLAVLVGLFGAGVHLLLELFFGAAMPQALDPLHQAARSGSLSVFDRLEWLQLTVWTMAASVKVGLYGYAAACLLKVHSAGENSLHGLPRFAAAAAVLAALCRWMQQADLDALARWQDLAAWGLVLLSVLTGGIRWLCKRRAAGA